VLFTLLVNTVGENCDLHEHGIVDTSAFLSRGSLDRPWFDVTNSKKAPAKSQDLIMSLCGHHRLDD
jgi:hypothetical protein